MRLACWNQRPLVNHDGVFCGNNTKTTAASSGSRRSRGSDSFTCMPPAQAEKSDAVSILLPGKVGREFPHPGCEWYEHWRK